MKNFHFIEGRPSSQPASQPADKENIPAPMLTLTKSKNASDTASYDHQLPPQPTTLSQLSFPSTPGSRIPLADLIGDAERPNASQQKAEESPQLETVRWNAQRSPRSSQHHTTPARGKKRSRSSSPPSTARPAKKAFNVYKPSPETTVNDPAADLWNRYSIGTTKEMPLTLIAESSSPRVGEDQAGNVSGLRRWTSCGIGWPASAIKRKRTRPDMIKEQVEDVFTDRPTNIRNQMRNTDNQQSNSRIGTLLERIQMTLAQPPPPIPESGDKEPSSSSPTPDKRTDLEHEPASPSRAPEIADRVSRLRVASDGVEPHRLSSDGNFGSEDLDDDMLEMAEQEEHKWSQRLSPARSAQSDQAGAIAKGSSPKKASQQMVPQERSSPKESPPKKASPPKKSDMFIVHEDDFDEGDEFDEDDIEQMATLCDSATQAEFQCAQPDASSETIPVQQIFRSAGPLAANTMSAVDDGDDFAYDDDEIDEESFAAAEHAATQSYRSGSKPSGYPRARAIQRYLIVSIDEGHYADARGRMQPEKTVFVEDEVSKLNKIISLRQSWIDTRCSIGSYVHVIGSFSRHGQCIIDDDQNTLILHPDHLISALVVADSFTCLRRAVLQDRIKAASEASPPMVYGTMLHEIFQEAMTTGRWDDDFLSAMIATIVARHIEDLYELKLTVEHVTEHLSSKMPEVQSWARIFVQESPGSSSLVKDRNDKQVQMSVSKVLDVEEHIWSPMYGLKGNIDATIQIHLEDEDGKRTLLAPFEVKTGRNTTSASHRAQTALYTLLLSDRYDVAVAYGILYYMESSETSRIPGIRHEIRHMIMQRNELACYVKERLELPPMIKSTHVCGRCYAKTACYTYHKLVEDGDGGTSGMREKFDKVVRNLRPIHGDFFKKWEDLLTKEETEMMKFRRELWTMVSTEREKVGRCFANVILEPGSGSEDLGSAKINRFHYTFIKRDETLNFSFSESQMAVGEPVVVSDENGHYALAKGYVTAILPTRITVAVDRRLKNARARLPGFDEVSNQTFSGITDPTSDSSPTLAYRLDKDEFSSGMAMVRNNLVQIMDDEVFHAKELRELIVEGRAPVFKSQSSAYSISGPQSQLDINDDQRGAIEKIMTAEDYALVLGMPGTGKTTTIAHIIRALVAKGKSVLLTSYTHTAVDNILLKIKRDNISVLRLGALAKIHPEVREFATLGGEPKTSIAELQKAYHEPQVVATTCLGISHRLFNERVFDYCIVDEASQITLPVCLGPIRMARAFVLVGDHYQLPPLVQNKEALDGGLDVSLFKLLSDMHPSAVATLHHQYRMCEEIMSISNALIYNGLLVCGSEKIAKQRLELSPFDALSQLHKHSPSALTAENACHSSASASCWLAQALSPSASPVIFLNTDSLSQSSLEMVKGSRLTNPVEASLTVQTVRALLLAGVEPTALGVITLYRSQLALIKSKLATSLPKPDISRLEAHTTDRFQGRDKDVVVMSCVRSNDRAVVGDLLKDWRRVNVAVTRAKKKLIIIGSKNTLCQGDQLLGRLTSMCEERGWMLDLPAAAHEDTSHSWPTMTCEPSPQASRAKPQQSVRPTNRLSMVNALKPSDKVNRPFKAPRKIGKLSEKAVLGSENVRASRPVLADIVNDVVGEGFFD